MSSNHGKMKWFLVKKYFKLVELDDATSPRCMHPCVTDVYIFTIKVQGSTQMWSTLVEIK
jgi:hypothetical protein